MSFEENIQKWVLLDNQIKVVNEKAKELRDKRSDLTKSLSTFVENKNMQNTTIEISDGKLKFVNTKVQ